MRTEKEPKNTEQLDHLPVFRPQFVIDENTLHYEAWTKANECALLNYYTALGAFFKRGERNAPFHDFCQLQFQLAMSRRLAVLH